MVHCTVLPIWKHPVPGGPKICCEMVSVGSGVAVLVGVGAFVDVRVGVGGNATVTSSSVLANSPAVLAKN